MSQARPGTAEPWRDPDATPFLRIEGVSKRFGAVVALDDVTLSIYRGELFALLGGSGSGKSTLLRALAGFEPLDAGRIVLDGQDMAGVPPWERPVNMMFQSYALFPHMSVAANIAFGLRQAGMPRAEVFARVEELLALVRLEGFSARRTHQLSGGQRARVALARALARRPKLLLLDEPLSALDKNLREQTQFELVNIQERLGLTFIIVTHDQEEAMTMATRLALMDRGALVQVGTPAEVYEFPNGRFSAEFLGTANIFAGVVERADADGARVGSSELDFDLVSDSPPPKTVGSRVLVAVRPEKMRIAPAQDGDGHGDNRLVGTVRDIAYYGDFFMFVVEVAEGISVRVSAPTTARRADVGITWDDRVVVEWPRLASVVLPE